MKWLLICQNRVCFLFFSLWNIDSRRNAAMSEAKMQIESIRKWVVEQLRTVGCLWLSGVLQLRWLTIGLNSTKKTNVKIIEASMDTGNHGWKHIHVREFGISNLTRDGCFWTYLNFNFNCYFKFFYECFEHVSSLGILIRKIIIVIVLIISCHKSSLSLSLVISLGRGPMWSKNLWINCFQVLSLWYLKKWILFYGLEWKKKNDYELLITYFSFILLELSV